MDIPKAVIQKADSLIESYGCNFKRLGSYDDNDAYQFLFPQNERTGFPYVYLYNHKTEKAEEITGMQALKIIRQVLLDDTI